MTTTLTRQPSMFIDGKKITEEDVFLALDDVLDNLKSTGNLGVMDTAIRSFMSMQSISGKGLAKLWWGLYQWWISENEEGHDDFFDYMEGTHQVKRRKASQYITLWDNYEHDRIPVEYRNKPLKNQFPVSRAIRQGYEIDDKTWNKLLLATNNPEVLEIVREVKNQEPRKSSLQIEVQRDGTIYAWTNNGREFIGYLNIAERDNEIINKAITRIIDRAGLKEK